MLSTRIKEVQAWMIRGKLCKLKRAMAYMPLDTGTNEDSNSSMIISRDTAPVFEGCVLALSFQKISEEFDGCALGIAHA